MVITKELEIGGRKLSIETGKYAKQADGAVMVRYGDTMVLATVVANKEAKQGQDFFPLQVEYREKTAAAGKIPGGYFKREGRPSEKEVLSSRLIDRPIRPLFPEGFRCETQVMLTVFSADQENDSDVLGAIGASAALIISDIPFNGPIAEVRVGRIDGQLVINPTFQQLETSDMDVSVAGTMTSINMVEGEAKEISEQEMLDALKFAHEQIKSICSLQLQLQKEAGRPKREVPINPLKKPLHDLLSKIARGDIHAITHKVLMKDERSKANEEMRTKAIESLLNQIGSLDAASSGVEKIEDPAAFIELNNRLISEILHDIEYEEMRTMILDEGKRLDGRGVTDIRPIVCEVGVLPRTHGSALFQRGETQSLTSTTLGTKTDEQFLDGLLPETTKRFMLHYNFPPYSVGEVGRLGSTGRREIGHGNLAERSLKKVLPPEAEFPYTVRIVSEILESNGSSSMATVCAGSLSLMDAGVPVKKAVAGIAMGLIKEDNRTAILSDILGNEDHLGDMDFKVAGTKDGITAFQMDIKIQGISFEIFEKALAQARAGRMRILEIMNQAISEPCKELSKYAPRLTTMKIPTDMIGAVIGPGGKMIRQIVKDSGAEVNIEDDGTIVIASVSAEGSEKAFKMISKIIEVPEVGKVYHGRVTRIMDFGAFVEFLPGKEGLIHISHIDMSRVNKVTDVINIGDEFDVKLIKKDEEGRYNLSRKALMPGYDAEAEAARDAERQRDRGPRRDGGGGHRRDGGGGHRGGGPHHR
ncbi:MAG: polyribonucleotide nucleotidyltransferase [Ignavibacteriae bacterium]|nr:polyribonucleotide nucleotidyltransferase [Ignavibacteria bacterium]MBI3363683.1 polyribonucleotide nucleotidyltransferase [Ignavibacteriota bacterium]